MYEQKESIFKIKNSNGFKIGQKFRVNMLDVFPNFKKLKKKPSKWRGIRDSKL
jgi:hypothetical protein